MTKALAVLRTAYRSSILGRFVEFWRRTWVHSGLYALLIWLMSLPCLEEGSAVQRGLDRCNTRLGRCNRLYAALYSSRLQR